MMSEYLAARCPTSMLLLPNISASAGQRFANWPGVQYKSSLDPRRTKNNYDVSCGRCRCPAKVLRHVSITYFMSASTTIMDHPLFGHFKSRPCSPWSSRP